MCSFVLAVLVVGATYGKIQGNVIDEESGEPLPYASVIVLTTDLGASTDENGDFFILNVPSGRYAVSVSCVGYQTKLVENVLMEIGQIVRLKVSLSQQPIELPPAVVTSEMPPVRKEMVAPTFVIKQEDIALLPFDYETGIVMFQPSVVNFDTAIHVRGGRANEVLYIIDNVPITDPLTGDLAIHISRGILEEVIFLPGGFDAEYGRAMSGVINVVTIRPSDRLRLGSSAKTERIMPFYYDFGYENYQTALHVPLAKKAKGLASFDFMHTDDWDPKLFILPHKERNDYSFYGKWQFSLRRNFKLTASGAKSMSKFDRYNSHWKYWLDHYRSDMREGDFEALNLTYLIRSRYMVSATLSRLFSEGAYGIRDENAGLIERFTFRPPVTWPQTGTNNPYGVRFGYFYTAGDYPESQSRSSETGRAAISTNLQIHKHHEAKAGIEYALLDLTNRTSIIRYAVDDSLYEVTDDYRFKPTEFSAYVQDNIDYRGMYAKLGLRFDRFDIGIDTIQPKRSVSPRIGCSFLITDRLLLRVNYGHYTQPPLYDQCYRNLSLFPIPWYLLSPILVGNPNLRPEKTKCFEVGVQGAVTRDLSLVFGVFNKDVVDLLGTRPVFALPKSYVTYYNVESAKIDGVETILDFRKKVFSGKISYTYSTARGTSSYAEEAYGRYYSQGLDTSKVPEAKQYFLDFDQRHRVFVQGLVNLPLQTKACLLGYLGNGFPYTQPGSEGKLEERNILRLPFNRQIDCLLLKAFKTSRFSLNFNVEVMNVLDFRYNIAPLGTLIPEARMRPENYRAYYTLFNNMYNPAADLNHDGVIEPGEYFEAVRQLNLETEDWPNCYTSPRRARLGVTLDL